VRVSCEKETSCQEKTSEPLFVLSHTRSSL
jgi:hypothetical protein